MPNGNENQPKKLSAGVGHAIVDAMLLLRTFSVKQIAAETGALEASVELVISELNSRKLLHRVDGADGLYEIGNEHTEAVRHFADRVYCPGGPGVRYSVTKCLLKQGQLTPELAAALTGTTVRRAGWELGRLLAEGLADCYVKDGKLEVRPPAEQQWLFELVDRQGFAELPPAGKQFPWPDNLWYWAAVRKMHSPNVSRDDLYAALGYIEQARKEAPEDKWLATAWNAFFDLSEAETHCRLKYRGDRLKHHGKAMALAQRSETGFNSIGLVRHADSARDVIECLEIDVTL